MKIAIKGLDSTTICLTTFSLELFSYMIMIVKESGLQTYAFPLTKHFEWKSWINLFPGKGSFGQYHFRSTDSNRVVINWNSLNITWRRFLKKRSKFLTKLPPTEQCPAAQDQSSAWNNKSPTPQFCLTLSSSEESLGKNECWANC